MQLNFYKLYYSRKRYCCKHFDSDNNHKGPLLLKYAAGKYTAFPFFLKACKIKVKLNGVDLYETFKKFGSTG